MRENVVQIESEVEKEWIGKNELGKQQLTKDLTSSAQLQCRTNKPLQA